jgi:uncharacterized protein with HEPN domain
MPRGLCMRHESLYLNDIVEAADYIAEFIAEPTSRRFRNRKCSAVL